MYVMARAMIILFLVVENAKVQTFICATQETNVTGTVMKLKNMDFRVFY